MFRYIALALMLSPGIAHAQKFVTVGEDTATAPAAEEQAVVADGTTGDSVAGGEEAEDIAVIDFAAFGSDVVFDGASIEEIEALLAGAGASALSADEQNAIITRIQTDDNGGSVLAIDVAGSDTSSSQQSADIESARLEIGECNEGTDWISDDINCFNEYPSDPE